MTYSEKLEGKRLTLRCRARLLAAAYYLKYGHRSQRLDDIYEATGSWDRLIKFNPDWLSQPRVPSGNPDGGQWTDGGGSGGSTTKPAEEGTVKPRFASSIIETREDAERIVRQANGKHIGKTRNAWP